MSLLSILKVHVDNGSVPGLVALVGTNGDTQPPNVVVALGNRVAGKADTPMQRDSIFRISSVTKPIVATAAMMMIEECKLRLDDPIDELVPELKDRRVLKRLDGPLEETVPAKRPISIRDLLTLRVGFGHIMKAEAQEYPIVKEATKLGVLHGPPNPAKHVGLEEWLAQLASLPNMHQPGERWMYELGAELLGVVIARASGEPLARVLERRIFEPCEMVDTAFSVPKNKLDRMTEAYERQQQGDRAELEVYDPIHGGFAQPPKFQSGASGLVSTVDDLHRFFRSLLDHRLISRSSLAAMTTDQVSAKEREGNDVFFAENMSWGLGLGVIIRRDSPSASPGRFGWDGGLGSSAWVDPKENLIGILLTQVAMTSPQPPAVFHDFWTAVYASLD